MDNNNTIGQIASLLDGNSVPQANELRPDVRSGTTFTYSNFGRVEDTITPVMVVWIYTIDPDDRVKFAAAVKLYEDDSANLPKLENGVSYRGTYSVSVSSASPDFEFRTFWGLGKLGNIGDLNEYLQNASDRLKDVLKFIPARPVLRSEIMGRTRATSPMTGSHTVE